MHPARILDRFLLSLVLIMYGYFLIYEFFPIFHFKTGDIISIRFFLNQISVYFYTGLTFILFGLVNLITV